MSIEDDLDGGLSAEEQAQFDSMRESALPAGSNIQSPDQITPPADPAPAPAPVTKADAPPPTPEPADDEDIETIKDATGKEVIDQRTGKPQRRVSFQKYQRAMAEMEGLKKQLAQTAEERHRIDERLKIINEALTTPEPAVPEKTPEELDPEPDPEQNIFEWVKWSKREQQREREARTQLETAWREEREDRQMAGNYQQEAVRFAGAEPNFWGAYQFLLNLRSGQLRAAGWTDETKIAQQVVKEEKGLVRNAFTDGESPAKRIFDMAKAAGFAPAPPPKPAEPIVPGTPLGQMKAPAVPPAAPPAPASQIPSVSEQVAMAAKGAADAISLSQGGGAPVEQLTQQKLLLMGDEEFNAVVSQLPKSKLRELFGD